MKFKHIWRHVKRWLFENDYYINSILTRRAKRLEFYEIRQKIKDICKQTKLEEKDYSWIFRIEISGEDYKAFGKLLFYHSRECLPFDDFLLNKHKLVWLHKVTGVTNNKLIGNIYVYHNELSELWYLWRDAPFWKDYAVWKKLHNMSEDF